MGLPKKKRGFRSIVFEDKKFNWRFSGLIDIRPELEKNNKVLVDFGWFDVWLYMNDRDNRPPDFEPKIVTSEFVKEAIKFSLENEWDITKKTENIQLCYRNGQFAIMRKDDSLKH